MMRAYSSTRLFRLLVAPQDTLVRFALMATHTKDQVDQAIEILKKIFMDMDLLKK